MRVLYFDAFSGVSGDMTVGALLSLGVSPQRLRAQLDAVPLSGYQVRVSEREINGIRACKFDVVLDDDGAAAAQAPLAQGHTHSRDYHHHHHHHDHEHEHEATGHPAPLAGASSSAHAHRSFAAIRELLDASSLAPAVRRRALAIFTVLAEAEGHVHGVPADNVTFHEVGAIDSIVDIVATAIGLEELGVEHVYVSPLPLGSGMVRSQHGILPVPAPATARILLGFPVRLGDGASELVTPTGAAIVAALALPGEELPTLAIDAVGYGAGTRVLTDRPNVLRLVLARTAPPLAADELVLLETNIDDSNPEIYEFVFERLFAAGARDVWLTPVQMKKGRPGTVLAALGDAASRDRLAALMLRETSALGVRFQPVRRLVSPRHQIEVETEYGTVVVKIAHAPDGTTNAAPEYESCRALALALDVPLKLVYHAALAAAHTSLNAK